MRVLYGRMPDNRPELTLVRHPMRVSAGRRSVHDRAWLKMLLLANDASQSVSAQRAVRGGDSIARANFGRAIKQQWWRARAGLPLLSTMAFITR